LTKPCIEFNDRDRERMAETGAVESHCPTSNQFLDSGLFDFEKAGASNMPVALATDVSGGTPFSMLQTMNEAGTGDLTPQLVRSPDARVAPSGQLALSCVTLPARAAGSTFAASLASSIHCSTFIARSVIYNGACAAGGIAAKPSSVAPVFEALRAINSA
jgi:hypothetical protein